MAQKNYSFNTECFGLVLLFVLFLLAGVLLADRLFPVWLDEVALAEPASNLYFNGEFTSSAWYHQSNDKFHVSTSPLYTFFLFIWMKMVGFSAMKVRLLNWFLTVASAFTLFISVKRLNLVENTWLRLLLVFTFIPLGGIEFNYIAGRYDTVSILLSLLAFCCFSIKSTKKRLLSFLLIGFLLPLSGLSALVFAILMCLIILIFDYFLFWRESFSLILGSITGVLFLFLLYSTNGVWGDFISLSLGHSGAAQSSRFSGLFRLFFISVEKLLDPNSNCGGCLHANSSWFYLYLLTLILLFYSLIMRRFEFKSFIFFSLISGISIPFAMCFLGKFPIYYVWMAVIPLHLGVFVEIDKILVSKRFFCVSANIIYIAFILSLWFSISVGLVSQARTVILNGSPNENYDLNQFIESVLQERDTIYADFSTFYAVKIQSRKINKVYFPLYFNQLSTDDIDKLSMIIIDPREEVRADWNRGLDEILGARKNNWKSTDQKFKNRLYHLEVYRPKER